MTVGERITLIRKKHKISQESLASALGIKQPTISQFENQDQVPQYILEHISKTYNVRLDWLLKGEEPIYYNTAKPKEDLEKEELKKEIAIRDDQIATMRKNIETLNSIVERQEFIIKRLESDLKEKRKSS